MEFDTQLLHDILNFLQTLGEVPLPPMFAALRVKLLHRMQDTLSECDNSVVADDFAEYERPEEQGVPQRSFLSLQSNKRQAKVLFSTATLSEDKDEKIVREITSNPFQGMFSDMNFSHAKARAQIYGQLHRREKVLFFESLRSFWAALVGWHFLIYNSRGNSKPSQVLPIKDCRCRPVATPKHIAKKLSKSTFEFWYNESKSFQFIASSPKKMEQWVEAVRLWQTMAYKKGNDNQNQGESSEASTMILDSGKSWRNSNSSEVYGDVVVQDIAHALSKTGKNQQPKSSTLVPSPKPLVLCKPKLKLNEPCNASHSLPHRPKMNAPNNSSYRLRPPIATMKDSQNNDNEQIYDSANEPSKPGRLQNGTKNNILRRRCSLLSDTSLNNSTEPLYDDLKNTNEEKLLLTENSNVDDETTYDDVFTMRKEVEVLKKKQNSIEELNSFGRKQKYNKPAPIVPTKTTGMKFNLHQLKRVSDSSQTEETNHKQTTLFQQQLAEAANKMKSKMRQSSSETDDDYVDKEIVADQSYNSMRQAHRKKSFSYDCVNDNERSIYDDVVDMKSKLKNHKQGHETDCETRRQNKVDDSIPKVNVLPRQKQFQTLPTIHSHMDVMCQLNAQFDDAIYQNLRNEKSDKHDSVQYEEMMSGVDAYNLGQPERKGTEQIYENVKKYVHINHENEVAPQRLLAQNSTQGPKVMAKPSKTSSHKQFNQFSSSTMQISTPEIKFQHQFSSMKKFGTKEIIPLKYQQMSSESHEVIYENPHAGL